jgi:hypothetical protein
MKTLVCRALFRSSSKAGAESLKHVAFADGEFSDRYGGVKRAESLHQLSAKCRLLPNFKLQNMVAKGSRFYSNISQNG